jgi:hypothetical protein
MITDIAMGKIYILHDLVVTSPFKNQIGREDI